MNVLPCIRPQRLQIAPHKADTDVVLWDAQDVTQREKGN
jgi:hypothetical protein